MRAIKIRIKDKHILNYLRNKIFLTQHFENMMIILINQDLNQNNGKNFKYLTNGRIMRAVFTGTSGGALKSDVDYIKNFYMNNCLMKDIVDVVKQLKAHNIVEQIKNIKKNYTSFFTKAQNGDTKVNKPSPKSLKNLNHATLYMDGYKSITLKRKNSIGLNLGNKMTYTHVNHKPLIKLVKNLSFIKNINLNYSNGFVYMIINYSEASETYYNISTPKYAGFDIGVKNIASIYIHDEYSPSLIIDGSKFIAYNCSFNRFVSKLNSETYKLSMNPHNSLRLNSLINFRKFLYEKRNNYFFSEFHKLSKLILKYLHSKNVTHLVLSKKISQLKNNGCCKINKNIKQHFMQIPLIKLIDNITIKAIQYNIKIIFVDESYTSKTSSISKNIYSIKNLSLNSTPLSTDDFGGSRVKRGLFKDFKYDKLINADLNGAFNICKLGGKDLPVLKINYKKLCNPIKIKAIAI